MQQRTQRLCDFRLHSRERTAKKTITRAQCFSNELSNLINEKKFGFLSCFILVLNCSSLPLWVLLIGRRNLKIERVNTISPRRELLLLHRRHPLMKWTRVRVSLYFYCFTRWRNLIKFHFKAISISFVKLWAFMSRFQLIRLKYWLILWLCDINSCWHF